MGMTAADQGIATVSLDSVDRWIAAVRAIPTSAKVFDVTPRRAELEFGITSALAKLLTDRGLPQSSAEGEARFSWADLHYVALRLGSARLYLRTIRAWARSMTDIALSGPRMVWLRYRAYASSGASVEVLLPEGQRVTAVIGADRIVATFNIRMANCEIAFPSSLQGVLHRAAALDFYILPDVLSGDVAFARRTGLADCATASRIVATECHQRGIEARMVFGLVVAPPLGTPHQWVEIRIGDRWVPADPLLLSVLGRFAGLDASRWSCTHAPSAILLPLAESESAIVNAADGPVETSFVVTVGEQNAQTSTNISRLERYVANRS